MNPKYAAAIERAQLTDLQRKYLDLYLAGHRVRAIAKAHGRSAATVREHIDTALEKIRDAMEDTAA